MLVLLLVINIESSSYPKYLRELAGGYALGAIGWCVGANLGNAIWETKEAVPICGYLLYGISSSVGVWVTGKQEDGGKYFDTVIGTVALPLIVMGIVKACGTESRVASDLIWFSLPIGTFIGYNLSVKE
jgi:hypothetical protein